MLGCQFPEIFHGGDGAVSFPAQGFTGSQFVEELDELELLEKIPDGSSIRFQEREIAQRTLQGNILFQGDYSQG